MTDEEFSRWFYAQSTWFKEAFYNDPIVHEYTQRWRRVKPQEDFYEGLCVALKAASDCYFASYLDLFKRTTVPTDLRTPPSPASSQPLT